jgi:cyclopropane fatty-acyl-phospholipid synthase-like methyltransferase
MASRLPTESVLSLGEGEGRNAVWLSGQGHDVTAVDASVVGLQKAQRLAAERGVKITTVHPDLAAYDIVQGSWDGIVSILPAKEPDNQR